MEQTFDPPHSLQVDLILPISHMSDLPHSLRSINRQLVNAHKDRAPACRYYKHVFDKLNRALHDRQWPHSRGGNSTQGVQGVHHDFLMAVVLQNALNAWLSAHDVDPASRTFESMCTELANSLYARSIDR